jgi:hypothetical protein
LPHFFVSAINSLLDAPGIFSPGADMASSMQTPAVRMEGRRHSAAGNKHYNRPDYENRSFLDASETA